MINNFCSLLKKIENWRIYRTFVYEHLSLLHTMRPSLVSSVAGKFTEAGKAVCAFLFTECPAQRRSDGAVCAPLLPICSHLLTWRLQQAIKAKVPKYCKCVESHFISSLPGSRGTRDFVNSYKTYNNPKPSRLDKLQINTRTLWCLSARNQTFWSSSVPVSKDHYLLLWDPASIPITVL